MDFNKMKKAVIADIDLKFKEAQKQQQTFCFGMSAYKLFHTDTPQAINSLHIAASHCEDLISFYQAIKEASISGTFKSELVYRMSDFHEIDREDFLKKCDIVTTAMMSGGAYFDPSIVGPLVRKRMFEEYMKEEMQQTRLYSKVE